MPLPVIGRQFNNPSLFGFPTRGLVSLIVPGWDVRGRNILPVNANTFATSGTGWLAFGGATITVTPGQPDPDGGNNAYLIQSSGGSNILKFYNPVSISNPHTSIMAIRAKLLSGNGKFNDSYNGGTSAFSGGWNTYSVTNSNVASPQMAFALSVNSVSDSLDILAYQPQINFGLSLAPYSAPLGLPQSTFDYSNHSTPFQLGSAATADTNDPLYNAQGLTFATNQYMLSGVIAGLDMRSFSMQIVGKFNGASGAITSLSDSASTTKYQAIKQVSSGNVAIISRNAGSETQSASLTVSATDTVALMLTAKDGTLTLENQSTGATVTLADTAPVTTCRIGIGCVAASTVAQIISAMTLNDGVGYTRLLSTSERRQAYSASKRIVSALGVTVA